MPSRAVIRKKARREKAKSRKETVSKSALLLAAQREEQKAAAQAGPRGVGAVSQGEGWKREAKVVPVRRAPRPPPKPRDAPAEPKEDLSSLPRKERKKLEVKQRFEKQINTLNRRLEATAVVGENGEEVRPRHDPKFNNGTFWRTRKERRARTVFLGGMPLSFSKDQITDFIMTVLDSDERAADYLREVEEGTKVVEEVDMLPNKHNSKVLHMYVTLASVALAGCTAARLDGYKLNGKALRCNFAADKNQRAEAILRRDKQ